MKIVYMGTPEFAIPSLEVVFKNTDLQLIFTKEDKRNARGNKMIDDEVIWQDEAWSEYTEWILERKISIIEKILKLIKDISRNGLLKGIGKPERLKHFKDRAIYSRRITDEHRLVYDMKDDRVRILGCKGHYKENYDK